MFADSIDELAFAALQHRRHALKLTQKKSFLLTLRLCFRVARLALHLLMGALLAVLTGLVFAPNLPWQPRLVAWWHRRFCRLLNLTVRVHGAPSAATKTQGALWVSNHVSWLDIPVLGAQFPVYFLSKAEVANWPLVGWLARMAGTLFIKRGAGDANLVITQLAEHLTQNRRVLFFPEGTTTDGHRLKRFFHKLFNAATQTQVPVQPVLICYRDEDDELHAHVPFVGDDEFLSHALAILRGGKITVDILVLPAHTTAGHEPRSLAQEVEGAMAQALKNFYDQENLTRKEF